MAVTELLIQIHFHLFPFKHNPCLGEAEMCQALEELSLVFPCRQGWLYDSTVARADKQIAWCGKSPWEDGYLSSRVAF